VFQTVSTSRLSGFFRLLSGGKEPSSDMKGACNDMCKDLCPVSCYKSFKIEGSKCTCNDFKCSGNAICNGSDKCQCKNGFNGNGFTCCDTSAGSALVGATCVFSPIAPPSVPIAPVAPAPKSPMAPTNKPVLAPRAPVNGRLDLLPPKLLQFSASSSTSVDVSSADAKIDFEITLQDDRSGLAQVYVTAFTKYQNPFVDISSFPPADGKPVQLKFSMPISKYIPSGFWPLYVYAVDVAGNELELDGRMLADLNYPYDIEVINSKGNNDTAPPKLLNLVASTPLTVNSTRNTTDILLQLTVQDDFSGVNGVNLQASGPSFVPVSTLFDGDRSVAFTSGVPLLANVTVTIRQGTVPGNYSLSVTLLDRADNRIQFSQLNLTSLGFPSTIRVVN
jgi:hypothetical protein